ncbi:MAG: hypothetical protein ACYDHU_10845 [Acidimicrobiales bacterium]
MTARHVSPSARRVIAVLDLDTSWCDKATWALGAVGRTRPR